MRFILAVVMGIFLNGCVVIDGGIELTKTIWGSSTRALEEARPQAIVKTYDQNYWKVVRAAEEFSQKKEYVIFKKDEAKGYMVLMGIKGSVNTTEVGIFFVEVNDTQTRIEISSLSTNAKRIVAKALFHGLDVSFGLAPPDPKKSSGADQQKSNESKS